MSLFYIRSFPFIFSCLSHLRPVRFWGVWAWIDSFWVKWAGAFSSCCRLAAWACGPWWTQSWLVWSFTLFKGNSPSPWSHLSLPVPRLNRSRWLSEQRRRSYRCVKKHLDAQQKKQIFRTFARTVFTSVPLERLVKKIKSAQASSHLISSLLAAASAPFPCRGWPFAVY